MSQLEEIKKLYVQKKEFKVPKEPKEGEVQATIVITPLDIDQLPLCEITDDLPMDEKVKKIIKLISVSLGEAEEDVKKIGIGYMESVIECIFSANSLDIKDDVKQQVLKTIKQKQDEASKKPKE